MSSTEKIRFDDATEWIVGERFQGWRLDRFLAEHIPSLSRTYLQKMIPERIRLSWRPSALPGTRLKVGGRIWAGHTVLHEVPENPEFPVLYECTDFLVVEKPAGYVVHPTNSCRANSVIEILKRTRRESELKLVHRLDRETSGLLLVARNLNSARLLGKAFMRREWKKTYLARVRGGPESDAGEITMPIGRDDSSRVFVRRKIRSDGETAHTKYRVLGRNEDTSLLELQPLTGRRHQLRVHCEAMGCPIVGDPLYGHPDENYLKYVRGESDRTRLFLHAWKLEGSIQGDEHFFISPPPPEFE